MLDKINDGIMKTADKGARIGNFMLDSLVFSVTFIVGGMILSFLFPAVADSPIFNLLVFISYFCYYTLFEYFLGRTPGKYLSRTEVVDLRGNRPAFKNILLRSFCRFIFIDYLSYIFGAGFHDVISRTSVVHK